MLNVFHMLGVVSRIVNILIYALTHLVDQISICTLCMPNTLC